MEFKLNTGSSIKRPFPDPHYALSIGVSVGLNFLRNLKMWVAKGCLVIFGNSDLWDLTIDKM